MAKQSKRHSSSARPSPARAAKQKDSGDQPKIPCKTVKNAILKSIAEQVDFQVDKKTAAANLLWTNKESQRKQQNYLKSGEHAVIDEDADGEQDEASEGQNEPPTSGEASRCSPKWELWEEPGDVETWLNFWGGNMHDALASK